MSANVNGFGIDAPVKGLRAAYTDSYISFLYAGSSVTGPAAASVTKDTGILLATKKLSTAGDSISTTLSGASNGFDLGHTVSGDGYVVLDSDIGNDAFSVTQVPDVNGDLTAGLEGVFIGKGNTFRTGRILTDAEISLKTKLLDNDSFNIVLSGNNSIGIEVESTGTLDYGPGNDRTVVTAPITVINRKAVPLELSGFNNVAIWNKGTINAGLGSDTIVGDGAFRGIWNTGTIDLGAGADRIDGYADEAYVPFNTDFKVKKQFNADQDAFDKAELNQQGTGRPVNKTLAGIYNEKGATIKTYEGDSDNDKDVIMGIGSGHTAVVKASYDQNAPGIYNAGTIKMGNGADVVDALSGGFFGNGTYELARFGSVDSDRDSVTGYGSGTFYAGGGLDNLTLPAGWYFIDYTGEIPTSTTSPVTANLYRTETGGELAALVPATKTDQQIKDAMKIDSFEGIAGFNPSAAAGGHFWSTANGALGALQVDSNGFIHTYSKAALETAPTEVGGLTALFSKLGLGAF